MFPGLVQGVQQKSVHFSFFNFSAFKDFTNSILDICLLFGEILTKILPKYWKDVVLKVIIFVQRLHSKPWT